MNKFRIVIAALCIFCTMSFFCTMTPLVFDDFGYGAGGSGLSDIFAAQLHEYRTWSGKFVGHLTARVLLHGAAWLHPLLSPLIFLGLVFCGVVLTLGSAWREKLRAWHLILLAGLVWFAVPAFGTVFFWRTGTADYGYGLFFATAFLAPYRFWFDNKEYRPTGGPLLAIGGLLAGWSNENVGMLVLLLALGVTFHHFRTEKKIPLWAGAGIAGALGGWLLMMTAPGNALRLAKIGGIEKIPLFSSTAFQKFFLFWGTQELEMVPYVLANLICLWLLYRQGRLKMTIILPSLIFLLMAQASLAAFLLSPSTPYRAMTATFFYLSCSTFALIVAADLKSIGAKLFLAAFSAMLLTSVLLETNVFLEAQAAIRLRDQAKEHGTLTAKSFNYPATDKYFFPTYDIIEINAWPDSEKYRMIPWDRAEPLNIEGGTSVRALVISNMVYLADVPPQGMVHVAAIASRQTVASVLQTVLRHFAPLDRSSSPSAIVARYAVASTSSTKGGKATLHLPGVSCLNDIAYISIREEGKPLIWRRILR